MGKIWKRWFFHTALSTASFAGGLLTGQTQRGTVKIIGARTTPTGGCPPRINWPEFITPIQRTDMVNMSPDLLILQIVVYGLRKLVVPRLPTSISSTVSSTGIHSLIHTSGFCRCAEANGNVIIYWGMGIYTLLAIKSIFLMRGEGG